MAEKAILNNRKKTISQSTKRAVLEYINILKQDKLSLKEVIVFGSRAKRRTDKWSDIDLCIISPKFKDPFKAMHYLLLKSYQVDAIIEPHPYHPKDFRNEDPLVWEIKKTGIRIPCSA